MSLETAALLTLIVFVAIVVAFPPGPPPGAYA